MKAQGNYDLSLLSFITSKSGILRMSGMVAMANVTKMAKTGKSPARSIKAPAMLANISFPKT